MKGSIASLRTKQSPWQQAPWSYLLAALSISAITGIIHLTHAYASAANIPMLYLLGVICAALFLGRAPAVLASILAFLSFDWFFVEPRYQFTVQQPEEWLALCTFLLIATVTGQLTALLRAQVEEASRRRSETAALAEASWAVASELDTDLALSKVLSELAALIEPKSAALLLPNADSELKCVALENNPKPASNSPAYASDAVKFVLSEGRAVGWDESPLWNKAMSEAEQPGSVYLPVAAENQVLAVLYLNLKGGRKVTDTERQVIDSLRNHAAVILQRDKLMKSEARAQALAEADRLKTALLSMVSHDFRSPLTSIKASVSSLLEDGAPISPEVQRSLLQGVEQETDRLNRMVGNILHLSKLESGAWKPVTEPTPVAELIGAALDYFSADENKRILVALDRSVTEITVDSVQIVQVIKNLIENALKYSPSDSMVELKTRLSDGEFIIEVLDKGRGLPKGEEQKIFEPFYRAPSLKESSIPGLGIGLTLCRGLVEANGGSLGALNREGGGSVFRISLPLAE